MTLIASVASFAQQPVSSELSPAEIRSRWAAALGGYQKLAAVESVHLHAKIESGGLKGAFDRRATSKGQLHETIDLGDAYHQESVLRDGHGWSLDPSGKVRELQGADLADLVSSVYESTWSYLVEGRMAGNTEFVGEDSTHSCYVWKLLPSGGKPMTVFLDKRTFLPRREEIRQEATTLTTVFSGWHEVNGLLVPGAMRQSNGDPQFDTVLAVESVEINSGVDAALFSPPAETAGIVKFMDGGHSVSIPAEVSGHRFFVKARVNGGEPGWFMLDSGAEVSVITSAWAARLSLTPKGSVAAQGASGIGGTGMLKDLVFNLPGLEVPAKVVAVLDFANLAPFTGHEVAGLLGYDVISRFAVRLDYGKQTIGLSDARTFLYSGSGAEIPLSFHGTDPQVRVKVLLPDRGPIEAIAVIDTGANKLHLTSPFVKENNVLGSVGKTITVPLLGVGGAAEAQLGRIAGIQIGPYTLNSPVALLAGESRGALSSPDFGVILGGETMERFIATFDYEHNRIFLEPGSDMAAPFPVDGSGLSLAFTPSKTVIVKEVLSDSAGEKAGIQKGDVIAKIDGRAAESLKPDDVSRMFEKSGQSYLLKLRRHKKTMDVILKVSNPF